MPRMIGSHYQAGATRALRQTPGKGTIPCVICGRPAADEFNSKYYCKYHLRTMRGW